MSFTASSLDTSALKNTATLPWSVNSLTTSFARSSFRPRWRFSPLHVQTCVLYCDQSRNSRQSPIQPFFSNLMFSSSLIKYFLVWFKKSFNLYFFNLWITVKIRLSASKRVFVSIA
jgi:hypothetical protein